MEPTRFDKKAANWDKKERRVQLAKAVSEALLKLPLKSEMQGMEFGCGTGLVGFLVAPKLTKLTAIDSSTGMITTLKEKIAETGVQNIEPLCVDLNENPLAEKFDFIFTSMTLHHIKEVDRTLATLYHHLKEGGILAIADLDEEDGSFHHDLKGEFTHSGFNREILTEKLTNLGFSSFSFSTVHTIVREDQNGVEQPYNVFLLDTKK